MITADINNIKLGNDNFDENDPTKIVLVGLTAWYIRFKKPEACKKI